MSDARAADLVLHGGALHTVDPKRPLAQALAVSAGRIVAVGSNASVASLIGARTRVIELRGRTVLPGFQDAHVHPVSSGLARLRCELHESHGLETYLRIVRDYAVANPAEAWIRGGGWSMEDFPGGTPRRDDLDRVVADRPVFLENRDGHGAWVNSRALELSGVTASTPDPIDGRIERDADGTPTGALHEGAIRLVERIVPPDSANELERGLLVGQAYLHALGVTSWQDAWVEPGARAAYRAVAGRGELTGRVVAALWWNRQRGLEQIEELVAARAEGTIGRFRPTSVKIMQDGVLENFSAAVLEPYLGVDGRPTDNRGISFVEPGLLRQAVTRLDAEGFQVHVHAIGERAVREALDAFEAALAANGRTDGRHHIAHIQVIHPADVPRFAALDVTANAQPYWACHEPQMDELTIPFLGPERAAWQYPFGSLLRAGARLAMGSDWSVSTPDPLLEMEVAVNRVSEDARGAKPPLLPDERISLEEAVRAFTLGSAYVQHQDDETGSLTVGRLADLVVLDRDLFDRAAGEIGDARVIATFVEGQPVFEDPALGA
ncbi:MAG: amidohydrolase [Chloroflexi bacterium]|nr:amidohydrolase [Chloroflexota bacterium]